MSRLLHIKTNENETKIEIIFPKYNLVITLDHYKFKYPHFMISINDFAKKIRYNIVTVNN